MFSLDKPEELIKIRLISSIWNNQFDSQEGIENLFLLSHPDIVLLDKNKQIALLVDVQAKKFQKGDVKEEYLSQVTKLYLQNAKKDTRFAMFAELEEINIFKWRNGKFLEPLTLLKTADILSHYDRDFRDKSNRIFSFYLKTLIEAWLRDLAYHWKSETPPAYKQLKEIELFSRLEGGDTYLQNDE
ncbi:hypothetical protein VB713_21595 [Anabaena cylindrica UHCC 0172]|uniref:hypothetical protein n=1 Tax=Anabaena cylindrica TaxID=1165 RepID=UPI002B1EBBA1|nr:hypothetical protein [Anabaena cylindrica]MEA5553538.1 hypothetical protein [Anabaena cylindrica UHCC 0172]